MFRLILFAGALLSFQAMAAAPFDQMYNSYTVTGCTDTSRNEKNINFCQYTQVTITQSATENSASTITFLQNGTKALSMGLDTTTPGQFYQASDDQAELVSIYQNIKSVTQLTKSPNGGYLLLLQTKDLEPGNPSDYDYNFTLNLKITP